MGFTTTWAASPILFVPKKDGSLRLCVEYRAQDTAEDSLPFTADFGDLRPHPRVNLLLQDRHKGCIGFEVYYN